ncbi:MAG: hypothetical protein HZB16_03510 [Armatimonadetes bacterium]|nr:hypothetical protein [Armatimonadota bacterium]
MSKRLIAVIAVVLVLLYLAIGTAREQAGLNRFDRAMLPVVTAMHAAAERACKDAAGVEAFHRQLPQWKSQVAAIKPPPSGYRAKLYQSVKGFFDEFEKYAAKDPLKSHETKLFEQIEPSLKENLSQVKHGPSAEGEGDEH